MDAQDFIYSKLDILVLKKESYENAFIEVSKKFDIEVIDTQVIEYAREMLHRIEVEKGTQEIRAIPLYELNQLFLDFKHFEEEELENTLRAIITKQELADNVVFVFVNALLNHLCAVEDNFLWKYFKMRNVHYSVYELIPFKDVLLQSDNRYINIFGDVFKDEFFMCKLDHEDLDFLSQAITNIKTSKLKDYQKEELKWIDSLINNALNDEYLILINNGDY